MTTKKILALAAALAAMSATMFGDTASRYVQDGLVACWDGYENAGTGLHDPSATTWKDLVGGYEFSLTGVTVADDRMVFAGRNNSYGTLDATSTAATFNNAINGTLEIVYAADVGKGELQLAEEQDLLQSRKIVFVVQPVSR